MITKQLVTSENVDFEVNLLRDNRKSISNLIRLTTKELRAIPSFAVFLASLMKYFYTKNKSGDTPNESKKAKTEHLLSNVREQIKYLFEQLNEGKFDDMANWTKLKLNAIYDHVNENFGHKGRKNYNLVDVWLLDCEQKRDRALVKFDYFAPAFQDKKWSNETRKMIFDKYAPEIKTANFLKLNIKKAINKANEIDKAKKEA